MTAGRLLPCAYRSLSEVHGAGGRPHLEMGLVAAVLNFLTGSLIVSIFCRSKDEWFAFQPTWYFRMNTNLALVLLLLAAAIAMFVANRPRMDAVALLMIVIMPFTGVITINEALAGIPNRDGGFTNFVVVP